MALLLNHTNPFLQILDPVTGDLIRFQSGRLEIEEDDPFYKVVMARAAIDPNIVVMQSETTCPLCGEDFTGKTAQANLANHRKNVHFAEWKADKEAGDTVSMQREIKAREGHACDVCRPVQAFGTEDDLRLHVAAFHLAAPELDDDGNEIGRKD